MWLIVALSAYFILAIVNVLDKYLLVNARMRPAVFLFYSTFPALLVFFCLIWQPAGLSGFLDWGAAVVSGFSFGLGLWAMYRALLKSEVSHIGPLIGGLIPALLLVFSFFILGESLTARQIWGVIILSVGTLALSPEYSRRHYRLGPSLVWAIGSAAFFALSHVLAKYLYLGYGFWPGFIWSRGFMGVLGALLFLYPPFWQWLKHPLPAPKAVVPKAGAGLVVVDKVLGLTGTVLIQYAIFLGSVTLVNALAGFQFAALVIMVFILSRWHSRFREEYSRAEIIQEVAAVILISIGLMMIV